MKPSGKKAHMHAQNTESRSQWTVEGILNVKVTSCAVHEKLNNNIFFTVSFLLQPPSPHVKLHAR